MKEKMNAGLSELNRRLDQEIQIVNDDFSKINEIYAGYFKEPYPARSCVEVAKLPKGVLIEVEAVAKAGKK